jgi:glucan biosynthesis protein C
VFGIALFHTARIFDILPFLVKNDQQSLTMMVLVGFVSQWGMPLLFVVAGMAAWHSLAKRTPAKFALDRFRRLVIPLVFGIFVLVPPQIYYNLRTNPDYLNSYWEFYPNFFRVVLKCDFPEFIQPDPAVGLFGPAHLWFLYYLFVFSLLALPLFVFLRRDAGRRFVLWLSVFCQKSGAIFLLALPVIGIETFILIEGTAGWNRYAYIPFLLCGYLFAADRRFEQALFRHRNVSLVLGTLTVLGFFAVSAVTYLAGTDPSRGFEWESVLWRLLKSCSSFLWIVAILGWAQKYKHHGPPVVRNDRRASDDIREGGAGRVPMGDENTDSGIGGVRRYVNEAVMPFYILHQTVIVVIGFYVVRLKVGITLKYTLIVAATLAVTLLLYDLVIRRTNLTRFLFGMKLL